MRRWWIGVPLAVLFMAGLQAPAWANSELHPAGRLFFPLWDVSSANRLTFIIVTREALNTHQSIKAEQQATANTTKTIWRMVGTGNCNPRGAAAPIGGDASNNVNRTDLGGSKDNPVFVDDVHFEYYGKSCNKSDEVVHMSCADIDLFLLSSSGNPDNKPRNAFEAVAADGRGALDVHLIKNNSGPSGRFRKNENSLMGQAFISDLSEGWFAAYPAAAAKATGCSPCEAIDQGTEVGYENYPMEVVLPFSFAENFPAPAGALRNLLSLWGPTLLPGQDLTGTAISIQFKWWDGRERFFASSIGGHSIIRPLGGTTPVLGSDPPIDPKFSISNFVCGHSAGNSIGKAENDGFPRAGTNSVACGAPDVADPQHPSDNFENSPDINDIGHTIQTSTPIGWWRFQLESDGKVPSGFDNTGSDFAHSGRGLVGVLISSTTGSNFNGVGDAWRLWHKDECRIAQSGVTLGPPHIGFWAVRDDIDPDLSNPDGGGGNLVATFNTWKFSRQLEICDGDFSCPHGTSGSCVLPTP